MGRVYFAGAIAVLAVGCTDTGGQTLVVLHNIAPDVGCIIDPAAGGSFISAGEIDATGVLDYGATAGYIISPAIENIADSQDGALATQRTVLLQGARVDLAIPTHVDGTELLSGDEIEALTNQNALKFTAPFTGSIEPDGGRVGIAFELVPAAVVAAIGPKLAEQETVLVNATFTVFGHTVGGSGVEADSYTYPITVCDGCLFSDLGSCVDLPAGDYPAGGACNLFQDAPSSCCLGSTGLQVCPAVSETIGQ
jgi:hypothetical protein